MLQKFFCVLLFFVRGGVVFAMSFLIISYVLHETSRNIITSTHVILT